MNQNTTWKWLLVVFIVAWSLYEIYPPQSRPLLGEFRASASNKDAAFNSIVANTVTA